MKRLLLIGWTLGLSAQLMAQGVFISEYIEGSSFNKALEVYNGTDATVNMNQYRLGVAFNGNANPTLYTFNHELAPGEVFVVCNSGANAAILAEADVISNGFANWNGDDFIGIYELSGPDTLLIDAIGILGIDPGVSWTVAGDVDATRDNTLIRKPTVTEGTADWALSAGTDANDSQWIIFPNNYSDDLGSHFVDVGVPIIAGLAHTPTFPSSSDAVEITANVTDNGLLTAVDLIYTLDGGPEQTVAMTLGVAPAYAATIPAQPNDTVVAYRVEATDDEANTTVSGTQSYQVYDPSDCDDIAPVRANDPDGRPALEGQVRTLCGVVTMGDQLGTAGPVYFTHATGSMTAYGANVIDSGVVIGDEVQITGTVGFFNGLTELVNCTVINITGHPGEPTPVDLTLAQLNADPESYEAQFVRVSGLELDPASIWPPANSNGVVTVLQGAESFAMFIDRDTDIDGSPAPSGVFTLSAVIGQYDNSSPYLDGHQLIPRSLTDFVYSGNQPPSVSGLAHDPYVPTDSESVTVTALVVDDSALTAVDLHYAVDGGGFVSVAMGIVSGDIWGGTIPAQADGAVVEYYVSATDDEAETSTSATFSYTVYAVFPCADIATIRANDPDGMPLLMGSTQYVCGVLTVGSEFGVGGPFYLTHATGSLALYGGAFNTTTAVIGDEIEVVGEVGFYNGLSQLVNNASVTILGHAGAPAPVATDLATLNADPESWEAQLVSLTGLELADPGQWPNPGSHATLSILQGAETFDLRIDRDTDIDENPAPVGLFNLVAVVSQFDNSSPYTEGYQLQPRSYADFSSASLDAPVVQISYAGGNVTLSWTAVPGASDYIVYSSATGYDGWDAGQSTGGATFLVLPASGAAFFTVTAVN
jgi:hypothetical protein